MEPSLFRYIWTHTRPQQLWILFIVLASLPTYFMSLELPKRIVNGPIQGRGFEGPGAQDTILRTTIGLPDWLSGGQIVLFPGFTVDRMGALVALSLAFLALVCVNGLFKFYINTYKGRLGERMLRRLRYELVDRVLRFPLLQFRRVKPSEVATMVKDEVEPLGGFIGDAFVQPVFLGGQALTAMVFILAQNVWLGLMAGGIVAVQAFVIPRLRRRLIVLGRQRQLTARELAGRVGEVVEGAASVHVNDTSNYERADIGTRLGRIFSIRYDLYQWKFFVKFLNNFLAQVTPFLFYLIGGYFALRGQLDIGQLVAVIAAYKDLPSPIKELIDWDQQRVDVQVKYTQVIEQFTTDNIMDPALQAPVMETVPPLAGEFAVSQLTVVDDTGAKLLENANVRFALGERVAAVGEINSGAETLAEALARLAPCVSGRITLGDQPLQDLPEAVTGRRIGYAGPDMFLAHGTIRDALIYGLKHVPLRPAPSSEADSRRRAREIAEAELAGNPTFDLGADWVDYEAAGATGPDDILEPIKRVLVLLDLAEDVFGFGLRGAIDPAVDPKLAACIVEARQTLRQRLPELNLAQLVEPFHPERYNRQATVAENLLFGTARSPDLADGNLAANPYMQQVLQQTGLDAVLFDMGRRIAGTAIELFADLPPDHPFFEQLSFMSAEQIPDYRTALARVENRPYAEASPADRAMFMRLPFVYIEQRHRLGLLDEALEHRLLEARRAFREGLPADLRDAVAFYEPDEYNVAASLQDNILFGRIAYGVAGAADRVLKAVRAVLDELGLRDRILDAGLNFNVGSGGKRLSASQRQKLGLARALLKRPDFLIVNRALSALDHRVQAAIMERVLDEARAGERPHGVLWVLTGPVASDGFDRILRFENGALVDDGAPAAPAAEVPKPAEMVPAQ